MARKVYEVAETVFATHRPKSIEGLPGIAELTVHPLQTPWPQFGVSYAGSWEFVTPASVEEILGRKEPRVPSYRMKCDEVWLLIYARPTQMSAWVEPPDNMCLKVRPNAFDRILFLYDASRVIEITS